MNRPIPENTIEIKKEVVDERAREAINFFEQNGFDEISSYISEKFLSWIDYTSKEASY